MIDVFERHSTVLLRWIELKLHGRVLVHFDAHSDGGALSYAMDDKRFQGFLYENDSVYLSHNGFLDIDNFIFAAVRYGIISKVIWVREDFGSNINLPHVFREFSEQGAGIYQFDAETFSTTRTIRINQTDWVLSTYHDILSSDFSNAIIDIDSDYFFYGHQTNSPQEILDTLYKISEEYSLYMSICFSFDGGFLSAYEYHMIKNILHSGGWKLNYVDEIIFPICKIEESVRYLFSYAMHKMRQKNYNESFSTLQLLLQYNIPGFHYIHGLLLEKRKEISDSMNAYKTALLMNPLAYPVIIRLGNLLIDQKKYDEAESFLMSYISAFNYRYEIYSLIGDLYSFKKETAIEWKLSAYKIQPISYLLTISLCETLISNGRVTEATLHLRHLLSFPLPKRVETFVKALLSSHHGI